MTQDALDRYVDRVSVILAAAMVSTLSAVVAFDRTHTYAWVPMLFASALLLAGLFKASLAVSGRLLTTPPPSWPQPSQQTEDEAYQSLLARVRKLEAAAVTGVPAYAPSFDVEKEEAKIARSISVTVDELREQAEKFRIRQLMEDSRGAELYRRLKKGVGDGYGGGGAGPQTGYVLVEEDELRAAREALQASRLSSSQAYSPEPPPLAEESPVKIETSTSNGSVLKRKTVGEMIEGVKEDMLEYEDLESSFSTNFAASGAQDCAAPIDIGSGFRNSF